jgi:hypothetical protein
MLMLKDPGQRDQDRAQSSKPRYSDWHRAEDIALRQKEKKVALGEEKQTHCKNDYEIHKGKDKGCLSIHEVLPFNGELE